MIARRAFLGLGAAGLIGRAQSRGEYFGTTSPPSSRNLVYSLLGEVKNLHPAKTTGGLEFYLIPALFDGLTVYHPHLPQPMPALATHYEVSRQYDQFTFYLQKPFAQGFTSNLFDIRVFKYARIDTKWRPQ